MKRLPNIQRHLEAEYRVLNVLASERSPIGFNELQGKASVSSRTLAEHLKNLIPTIVQKIRGKYCITDAGRQRMENIKHDLETWMEKVGDRQPHVEIVEVYSIGPKHFCKGTLKITSPKRLLLGERGNLDKALTHAIRTFSSIVPQGSRDWRISIYSHTSSKPKFKNTQARARAS